MLLFPFNGWENRSREAKPLTLYMQLVLKNLLIRFSDIRILFFLLLFCLLICLFLSKYADWGFVSAVGRKCSPAYCIAEHGHQYSVCVLAAYSNTFLSKNAFVGMPFRAKPVLGCCELLSKNQAVRHILLCLLDFSIASTPTFSPKLLFIYFSVFVRSCWLLYWVEIFIVINNTHLTKVNLFWASAFIIFVSVFAAVLSKYRFFAAGVSWIDSLAEKS